MTLAAFRTALATETALDDLAAGLIGEGVMIPGPQGDVPLVYADYVASGRALRQVEGFIATEVLPYYANSHTEASYCGALITQMRAEARAEIARLVGATEAHEVIFAGSGATAGLNRLVHLLGVEGARKPVVFIGPYEHHSNILPWRESRAEVIEIPEGPDGGPDLAVLEAALVAHADADLKIGSFSAASNVTGVVTDPAPVLAVLKAHDAVSVWDYAGGGPYLPINMATGMDAIVVSPHKFPGGPGASGVFVVNRAVVRQTCPSWPGGGTVSFVSPWRHDYIDDLAAREEAGTPNVIGDIRAALAFLVKDAVGDAEIARREARFNDMALAAWGANPQMTILGAAQGHRLPIFSLLVRDQRGAPVSPQLFTRLLSDIYGIQARGGCACAGPYGHRLLGIGREESEAIHTALAAGEMVEKPGWTRLNFSYLMDEERVRYILDSVTALIRDLDRWTPLYDFDPATGQYAQGKTAA
ncbi:aminotransferase class V-fold PLP-dependent enzyme [Aliiroseovarius subalbicans]|uniref:aminotransferase class V-fold PLP-dependent enzyme n=1 Tax=Aliiroseovarius subalbicans TaxID=2925840 RepID=UPI001F57881B|nr:aminotransferase class V-fold PLP-dependent enzyme [Aliiroseovarius subalbicans]MCI2400600.1 aminotransferase class V-fold PLP-dependent enzyme [Aliiroseovarius subalbicans]